jgi:hypothetical protein
LMSKIDALVIRRDQPVMRADLIRTRKSVI